MNNYVNVNGLHITLDRKIDISQARPPIHTALRAAAESLSRRNADQAICELMNEALANLITLLYERDGGGLCNVDAPTGRILIPLPWGRNGYKRWGLRPQESDIMREIMFAWEEESPSLLLYHRTRRAWYVNLIDFGKASLANMWLREHQITIAVYRSARSKRLGGGVD